MFVDGKELARAVLERLDAFGFRVGPAGLDFPARSKDDLRRLYLPVRLSKLKAAAPWLRRVEGRLLGFFADGREVEPDRIDSRTGPSARKFPGSPPRESSPCCGQFCGGLPDGNRAGSRGRRLPAARADRLRRRGRGPAAVEAGLPVRRPHASDQRRRRECPRQRKGAGHAGP